MNIDFKLRLVRPEREIPLPAVSRLELDEAVFASWRNGQEHGFDGRA
ncbi:hypothetical protein [Paenibacillus sp. UNC451MF]|nr:hypothetical protein [Paenibacillus sp. UNC451MF]